VAISEESRHHLYTRLEQVLGSEEAATLMEHLPPVGWADVATKRDLDHLETRLEAKFEAKLNAAITSQTRTLLLTTLGSFIAFSGVVIGLVR
jgi:hypothetical protein